MKKVLLMLTLSFLVFGLVGAADMPRDGTGDFHDDVVAAGGQGGNPEVTMAGTGVGQRMALEQGEYQLQSGKMIGIKSEGNRIMLQVGEHVANCDDCNLTQEMVQDRLRIHTQLSNGQNAEIKIMPDTASETAIRQLKLRNCNESCTIELKEVGTGNQTRMAYEVSTRTRAKFLGLFGTNANVSTEIDAETGEVIRTRKPWFVVLQDQSA
ncbi:hypothetical protein GW932_03380 [archaeon]|nr:hypothetical protein [archaeon]